MVEGRKRINTGAQITRYQDRNRLEGVFNSCSVSGATCSVKKIVSLAASFVQKFDKRP